MCHTLKAVEEQATGSCRYLLSSMLNSALFMTIIFGGLTFLLTLVFTIYVCRYFRKDLILILGWAITFGLYCLDLIILVNAILNVFPLSTVFTFQEDCR